jgi:hypothetical protein
VPKPRLPFDQSLDVLEKNKLVAGGALGAVVLGPLMLLAAIAGIFPPGFIGFHVLLAGLLLSLATAWKNVWPTRRSGTVRADAEGVWRDGALVVPRARIADGFFQPRAGRDPNRSRSYGSSVRLVDKQHRIVFEAEADERQALDILWALGLDPASKRVVFNGSSPMFATLARNLAFIFGSMIVLGVLSVPLAAMGIPGANALGPFFTAAWFLGAMLPSKISVGIDGVHLRWWWQKKLIPMSTIRGIERADAREIRLRLADGSEHTIYTSMRSKNGTSTHAKQHCDAVIARLLEAKAAFDMRTSGADVSALLGKGTRTRDEWREALDKLRSAEGGYRQAVVRDDDLWRVVEDPSAPDDARGAAAVLLRRSLDDEGRARVRVAAEATASPKLRIALDAAAGEKDETVEAALDDLADDAPAGRQA